MALLSPLAPSSAPLTSPPADLGGPPHGRAHGPAVPAVDRARGMRDALRDHAHRTRGRHDEAPRPDVQDQETERFGTRGAGPRDIVLRRERDAESRPAGAELFDARGTGPQLGGPGFSAAFLAQVFGQDLGRPQVFMTEHRDAATRGSEAYRQAGAAPPVYSEEPALFRFAI